MVPEARLRETSEGLVPEGEGWFVLNARQARWAQPRGLGRSCDLEGDAHFPQLGFRLVVLEPGQPNCMYHGESDQEDFLVIAGECLLVVEGQERPLRQWDFVHCPRGTRHVFVGAGQERCVIVMVGARTSQGSVVYPVEEAAARHGASVAKETTKPEEAYARYSRQPCFLPYRDGDLP
ncbi:MAG: hypothetical protein C4305_00920 [Thermoleophilia bacterium]